MSDHSSRKLPPSIIWPLISLKIYLRISVSFQISFKIQDSLCGTSLELLKTAVNIAINNHIAYTMDVQLPGMETHLSPQCIPHTLTQTHTLSLTEHTCVILVVHKGCIIHVSLFALADRKPKTKFYTQLLSISQTQYLCLYLTSTFHTVQVDFDLIAARVLLWGFPAG